MKLIQELRIATLVYMVRNNLTQQQMAKRLHVTQPCIRAWCFEDRNVLSEDVLERLVGLLRDAGLIGKSVSDQNILTMARAIVRDTETRDTASKKRLAEVVQQHSIKAKPVTEKGQPT